MTPVLAFDIETVPDVAGLRRLHELPAPDHAVSEKPRGEPSRTRCVPPTAIT